MLSASPRLFPALLLACLAALAVMTVHSPAARAAGNGSDTPWSVTRKADNRVLPKQDNVQDIEKGLAQPGAKMGEQTGSQAAKASGKKPASAPKAAPKAAVVSGKAGVPQVSVSPEAIVITLPTSATVTDTRYLNLDNPRRLALDVMGSWEYSNKKEFALERGAASKMAVGKHPEFLRLVLHFTRDAVPAEIVPRFQLVEGGLKMTVSLK